jgi:hypothetical protein
MAEELLPEPEPEPEVEPAAVDGEPAAVDGEAEGGAGEEEEEDEEEDEGSAEAGREAEDTVGRLPGVDADDIIAEDGDAPMGGGFDTDQDDTTDTPQYVYVQHPVTKRISRQKTEELERDRGRKADEKRKLERAVDVAAGADSGRLVLERISYVTAVGFLLCQSLFAGVAMLLLVMSAASIDFVEYYSPLAGTTRNVVMFLSSLCILGSFEKHGREAAAGWQGRGWERSVSVITLYCISFFLTLLNTPMDDRAAASQCCLRALLAYTCRLSPASLL